MRGDLAGALGIAGQRYVYLVGAGGKTTLMFALAHALAPRMRVITTTSTRILRPAPEASPEVLVGEVSRLIPELRALPPEPGHRTLARAVGPDGKLLGFPPPDLDHLLDAGVADLLLVEGDGAAGLPLKAHADHEPVVSARADLVVAVVAADAPGGPFDDTHVHRAHLARERLGKGADDRVTLLDVAALFFHPKGYLRGAPGEVAVFVSRAGPDPSDAWAVATALHAADQNGVLSGIAVGELVRGEPWVEVWSPPWPA